jgi:glycine/D-amino acid oxidase-like deaminating enzyme
LPDLDVLIVGGGIAGWSAAYFAVRCGRHVTVVDEGVHRASDLPIALVNPLRGHAGRLVPRGVEGMRATFDLIDRLRADGHAIAAGRGLHRPLVDLQGDPLGETYWRTRIANRLAFDFVDPSPIGLGLLARPPSLYLPQAGWVAAPELLAALRADSGLTPIEARVEVVTRDAVRLADGTPLRARSVIWCGGAWGAQGLDRSQATTDEGALARGEAAIYKPGSLATTADRFTDAPMTFGLYAAPWGDGTLVGPTREDAMATFPIDEGDDRVMDTVIDPPIARLQERVRRLFGPDIALASAWRGVRLARLSTAARDALRDVATLTALGSRGFLMAPLLAREIVASL